MVRDGARTSINPIRPEVGDVAVDGLESLCRSGYSSRRPRWPRPIRFDLHGHMAGRVVEQVPRGMGASPCEDTKGVALERGELPRPHELPSVDGRRVRWLLSPRNGGGQSAEHNNSAERYSDAWHTQHLGCSLSLTRGV